MINMTLKWHHKNISNKITILIEFWYLLDMFFRLFDYYIQQFIDRGAKMYDPSIFVIIDNYDQLLPPLKTYNKLPQLYCALHHSKQNVKLLH